jgi:hypothetical protein
MDAVTADNSKKRVRHFCLILVAERLTDRAI